MNKRRRYKAKRRRAQVRKFREKHVGPMYRATMSIDLSSGLIKWT